MPSYNHIDASSVVFSSPLAVFPSQSFVCTAPRVVSRPFLALNCLGLPAGPSSATVDCCFVDLSSMRNSSAPAVFPRGSHVSHALYGSSEASDDIDKHDSSVRFQSCTGTDRGNDINYGHIV